MTLRASQAVAERAPVIRTLPIGLFVEQKPIHPFDRELPLVSSPTPINGRAPPVKGDSPGRKLIFEHVPIYQCDKVHREAPESECLHAESTANSSLGTTYPQFTENSYRAGSGAWFVLTTGFALHERSGRIAWCYATNTTATFVGTYPWQWVAHEHQQKCQQSFGLALMGVEPPADEFALLPERFGGANWGQKLRFFRSPTEDLPVVSVFDFFSLELFKLSPREREIAKLMARFPNKKIARQLGITINTVETLRQRLSWKLKRTGPELLTWCALHADVL